jgi:hypothetical protein
MKRNSERGQMTVEMVLLVTLIVGLAALVSSQFREKALFAGLVSGPWPYLKNMNEFGQWDKNTSRAMSLHPNGGLRLGSPIPLPGGELN